MSAAGDAPLLAVRDLHASYGPVEVLHGIDLDVGRGQIVAVLGSNGAGKTTTLRALSGAVDVRGSVTLDGDEIAGRAPEAVARLGVAHVPQGRGTFVGMTVVENLRLGGYLRRDRGAAQDDVERMCATFEVLGERRHQPAGSLSGGEQQMLAIARALMMQPRILLLDEPSLGLAPMITRTLFEMVASVNADRGVTVVLVEQNAHLALDIAHAAYVLEAGRIVMSGTPDDVRGDEGMAAAYLGYGV